MDHQHTLQLNGSKLPSFICSGCKEPGFESSYICQNTNCNYILHKECAEPVNQAVHPFFINCNFEFIENAEKECFGFCNACGKDLLGSCYICPITRYALHTCCLNLEENILNDDGNVIMTLSNEVPSDCVHCKQKHVVRNQFEGWSYVVNSDGKSCVHVSCFNDMILENLKKKKPRRRMRSFMKFIGKLVVNIAIDLITGDITNSISTIVEALARSRG